LIATVGLIHILWKQRYIYFSRYYVILEYFPCSSESYALSRENKINVIRLHP